MRQRLQRLLASGLGGLSALVLAGLFAAGPAKAEDPIKIGFDLSQTGPLAPNGKQALLGAKIWEEEVNAKGGLLGRKVELIGYDDQSNPSNVPGIYAKRLDVDKVDLVMGPYGTNLVAPAIPIAMQKNKVMIGMFALEVNSHFHYANYFSMVPYGPDPKVSSGEGFFAVAAEQNPKPQTVAIVSEDSEFGRNGADSGEINAKRFGMKVVYNKSFPPGTTDFSPVIRAVAAANADIVMVVA
jgi:branched-chain amino acid transport system substrate-binding protein